MLDEKYCRESIIYITKKQKLKNDIPEEDRLDSAVQET